MTILAMVSVQEPYAHHFPLSSFSQHHPQTFPCSYFPFFLLSLRSLWMHFTFFPEVSPAGLWHIAELTSPSTPAPGALSQTSPAASSLLQPGASKHSSKGWAIAPADEMLVSSRHKASPTPPCHLCRWNIAGAFQGCQQLSTGSLCPLQLATRLLCLPGPFPVSLQSCWLRTPENAQFLNISCVVSKSLVLGSRCAAVCIVFCVMFVSFLLFRWISWLQWPLASLPVFCNKCPKHRTLNPLSLDTCFLHGIALLEPWGRGSTESFSAEDKEVLRWQGNVWEATGGDLDHGGDGAET